MSQKCQEDMFGYIFAFHHEYQDLLRNVIWIWSHNRKTLNHIHGLVQDCRNSIALSHWYQILSSWINWLIVIRSFSILGYYRFIWITCISLIWILPKYNRFPFKCINYFPVEMKSSHILDTIILLINMNLICTLHINFIKNRIFFNSINFFLIKWLKWPSIFVRLGHVLCPLPCNGWYWDKDWQGSVLHSLKTRFTCWYLFQNTYHLFNNTEYTLALFESQRTINNLIGLTLAPDVCISVYWCVMSMSLYFLAQWQVPNLSTPSERQMSNECFQ